MSEPVRITSLALVMVPALAAIACTGEIPGRAPPGGTPDDRPATTTPSPGGPMTSGPGIPVDVGVTPPMPGSTPLPGGKTYRPFTPLAATMSRLTVEQYTNTIADIFGADVQLAVAIDEDETQETFRSIGAAKVGTSVLGVEKYQNAALAIADQVLRNRARYPWIATCAATAATDPCVAAAFQAIGLRLFRRPLTADEVQRYVKITGADGAGKEKVDVGLKYALATMLQSPHFLYLVNVGEPDTQTGYLRYTGHELASRLAYFLWSSTPDPELLEAARTGKLATKAGVDAEVRRMLDRPRARSAATRFLSELWNVGKLDADSKNTKVFPTWTTALLASYRRELELTVEDLVFTRDGDVRDLFDARDSFVNAELMKLYGGTGGTTSFAKMPLPANRTGILTSGAIIAANSPADRTSPTHRGVFVLERILCKEIPPPPPNANDALPEADPGKTLSVRERLEKHRSDPGCAACHALFDPLGMTFEVFDGIGVHRTMDAGKPIDGRGELEGKTFASVKDVAAFLRADARTPHCLAKHLYSFAAGHEVTPGEEGLVEALGDSFAGGKMKALLSEVASSAGFRYFAKGQ